jgi:hypothetical protein
MKKLKIIITILIILSCSKKSESPSEPSPNPDIQIAIERSSSIPVMSFQAILEPNFGGMFRTRYTGGFFLYQNDSLIDLSYCRSFVDPIYDTDTDKDGIYDATGILFNCDKVDTIIRNNKQYEIRYKINGYAFHLDTFNYYNDPYSFSVSFGEAQPFESYVMSKRIGTNDSIISYYYGYSKIIAKKFSSTTIKAYIERNIDKIEVNANCPKFNIKDSVLVDFSNAPNWKPNKDLKQGEFLLFYVQPNGDILTCNNDTLKIKTTTIEPIKVSFCSNGEQGPISGKLKLDIYNKGITKYINFNDCSETITDN